jgi:hypothetical protein
MWNCSVLQKGTNCSEFICVLGFVVQISPLLVSVSLVHHSWSLSAPVRCSWSLSAPVRCSWSLVSSGPLLLVSCQLRSASAPVRCSWSLSAPVRCSWFQSAPVRCSSLSQLWSAALGLSQLRSTALVSVSSGPLLLVSSWVVVGFGLPSGSHPRRLNCPRVLRSFPRFLGCEPSPPLLFSPQNVHCSLRSWLWAGISIRDSRPSFGGQAQTACLQYNCRKCLCIDCFFFSEPDSPPCYVGFIPVFKLTGSVV